MNSPDTLHANEGGRTAERAADRTDHPNSAAAKQARRLATILVVNKRLALGPPLAETLPIIVEEATHLLGVEAAGLRLREGDALVRAASFGPAGSIMVRERLLIGESLSGAVVHENRPILSTDLSRERRFHPTRRAQARLHGLRAWMGVPLRGRDEVLGVLFVVDRVARRFEQADIQLLEAFADQTAIAIENAHLYRQVGERESRLRELVGQLLHAQEEERRRVAYDVHDGLAQVAAASQQHLEAYVAHHRPRSAKARQELDQIRDLAQRTVREARRVISGLRPTLLDDFGLVAALGREVEMLRDEGWQIDYEAPLGDERLPPTIETALFRVAQEALENVRKHAATTRVHLTLERERETVHLEVRDEGRGFRPGGAPTNGGPSERVGLLGMRERVAWLGGSFTVDSRSGAGTRVVVRVPLETGEAERTANGG